MVQGDPPEGALRVLRDVYFTGDTERIDSLLRRADPLRGLRVYSGYSAWGRGQLQSEIARGSWHMVPADADAVFGAEPAGLWRRMIERAITRHTRGSEADTTAATRASLPDSRAGAAPTPPR